MNPIIRNILAVVAGAIIGGVVNSGLIILSPTVIPLPDGVNPMVMEDLKANMHLFETKHFIMPFLAHALGTLVGAFITAKLAANNHMILAMIIGALFMVGGIFNIMELGGPTWFTILDLAVAYFPMAFLGWKLAGGKK